MTLDQVVAAEREAFAAAHPRSAALASVTGPGEWPVIAPVSPSATST